MITIVEKKFQLISFSHQASILVCHRYTFWVIYTCNTHRSRLLMLEPSPTYLHPPSLAFLPSEPAPAAKSPAAAAAWAVHVLHQPIGLPPAPLTILAVRVAQTRQLSEERFLPPMYCMDYMGGTRFSLVNLEAGFLFYF